MRRFLFLVQSTSCAGASASQCSGSQSLSFLHVLKDTLKTLQPPSCDPRLQELEKHFQGCSYFSWWKTNTITLAFFFCSRIILPGGLKHKRDPAQGITASSFNQPPPHPPPPLPCAGQIVLLSDKTLCQEENTGPSFSGVFWKG